ncbi:metal transporter CNNM4, partial [Brachionus plicatilis]
MLFKAVIVEITIFTLLNVVYGTKSSNVNEISFPKLLYSTPKSGDNSHTLNELDPLTNELKKGWIFKADKEIQILFYILVDSKITNFNLVGDSYVFFTNNPSSCSDSASHELFKIKFLEDRSKIHDLSNENIRRRKARQPGKNELFSEIETTLLVGQADIILSHSSDKYYTCVSYAKNYTANEKAQIEFSHQGIDNIYGQIITTKDLLPIYLVVIFYLILLFFSALFSGLNLGLMSLDLTELNILKKIGTSKEKRYAAKIFPLRKRGNLLLCTILIGNVLVNSTSTLILGNYLEGLFAAFGSTMLIVIFGEIIPQAICSRHGLAVGTYTRFITHTMVYLTFIVSYPLSKILDFFLGKEIASTYNRDLVRELMRQAKDGKGIEETEFKILSGALDFKDKVVKDIMVPLNDVFSLDINSILDFETFKLILHQGYSRIPVYEGS